MTHAGAYAACADTELVAVCDADPERAAARRRALGRARLHRSAARCWPSGPELVSVPRPTRTHAELVEAASARARRPRRAGREAARARRGGRRARSWSSRGSAARARGQLHAPLRARRSGRWPHADGRSARSSTSAACTSRACAHNGTHWLDLLRMLAGEPVVVRGWDRLGEGGEDPSLDAELRWPGAGARLAGLDTAPLHRVRDGPVGTRGRVRVAESGHVLERWAWAPTRAIPATRAAAAAAVTGALRDGVLHAVRDVVRCVRDGRRAGLHRGRRRCARSRWPTPSGHRGAGYSARA